MRAVGASKIGPCVSSALGGSSARLRCDSALRVSLGGVSLGGVSLRRVSLRHVSLRRVSLGRGSVAASPLPAEPTIYALSTASGKAAIAVVRVSGPACTQIYNALCPATPFPKPRHATLRTLYSPDRPPSPASVLDSAALVLFFPGPKTVTGEDVLELHLHGGPAIVRAVLAAIPTAIPQSDACPATPSIRYAEPGEFTRRAFANNRMDLPQIESLGETLSASTEQQRRLSVRGTTSSLAARYEHWRTRLLAARGELEALIDFSEDQHFDQSPVQLCASVALQVHALSAHMQAHVANAMRGELLRNGITLALLGAPNAGKSSLLNRIVGRDAAIVSPEAGTTRDIVDLTIDLAGFLVRIADMAGLRRAGLVGPHLVGTVEQEGIKRAKQRALESDVVIVVQDATADIDPEVIKTATQCANAGIHVVVAVNKMDQLASSARAEEKWKADIHNALGVVPSRTTCISCSEASITSALEKDPGNIQSFLATLTQTFHEMTGALVPNTDDDPHPDPFIWQESLGATERQRVLLSECLTHLDAFLAAVSSRLTEEHSAYGIEPDAADDIDIVLAAESLRSAADSLARITGRGDGGDVDEVLGVVFDKFCVGK